MREIMKFPENPMDFIKDHKRHTNGTDLIPVYRVKQMLEHYGIRKTDNNDWTPVEDGLPEETGYYLVTLSRSLPDEDYSNRVVVLFDECENQFMCYENLIVAWMPLPESYNQAKGEPEEVECLSGCDRRRKK